MWQGSEYASGCNYARVLNIPGFRVCQASAYARVAQGSKYAWMWLNNVLWQSSEYTWSTFHKVSNKLPVLNMPRLRIWQGCNMRGLYKVLNLAESAWVCLKDVSICVNDLTMLNMINYDGIYLKKQSAEYARMLDVSDEF